MAPILEVRNLTHTYSAGTPFEHKAIDNMNFSVERGEFIGIIGHTGSGKSTLMQHLNGLLKPTSGTVLLDGEDIHKDKKFTRQARFRVGLVFQYPEYQLFEETVYKDIAFGPKNMGRTGEELDRCVREAARMVGLRDDQLDKSPFELSGGQKRRVAIAGVIAMEPKVLILDEPTAGLDPKGRDDILAGIKHYHESTGAAVILVSHSMEDVATYCDELVVMSGAKVIMHDTPRNVFSNPEFLVKNGLDLPHIARLNMYLRQRGIDLGEGIYTVLGAFDKIMEFREK